MRIINAFTIQRIGLDATSGILDWLLSPIYMKQARPNDTLVLYTNNESVELLGELWQYIKKHYDEVNVTLKKPMGGIFSMPKFEAMENELKNHGTDFIMVDNDLYAFPGFLVTVPDFGIYFKEPHLLPWYRGIVDGHYDLLNAPSWVKWKSIPVNCAIIRLNNAEFLKDYFKLFYRITATRLPKKILEVAVVKEQWSLAELFAKYKINPVEIEKEYTSFHKGRLKNKLKPSHVICLQEYLLSWLDAPAFKAYKRSSYYDINLPPYDINWCLEQLDPHEKVGLMHPIKKLINNKNGID